MKSMTGSYFMFSPCKYREQGAGVWCSPESASAFLGHQKHFRVGFSLALSSQNKYFHSISAASSALPSAETQQTASEIVKLQAIDTDQPKTVHVRFKLQKECAFGEQFLIVGDDPIIGLWEPSDGVPLNWCDGHVWIAELDLPSSKVIKYKFLLKGETGTISWQLGPDRILETWDTEKIITVFEYWDSPELQNIVESDHDKEILVNSDLIVVDENLRERVTDEGTCFEKELVDTSGFGNVAEKSTVLLVAENILGEELRSCESVIDLKKEITAENGSRLVYDGVPVLVPGLIPTTPEEIEAAMEREDAESTSNASDGVEEATVPELNEAEHICNSFEHPIEEMIDRNSQAHNEKGQLENSVLEGDKQWGRLTLQKFLASLGF